MTLGGKAKLFANADVAIAVCAVVIITLLPALIIFILCQKQIYGGLAAGSVKG